MSQGVPSAMKFPLHDALNEIVWVENEYESDSLQIIEPSTATLPMSFTASTQERWLLICELLSEIAS
jgi:hypothetical protein